MAFSLLVLNHKNSRYHRRHRHLPQDSDHAQHFHPIIVININRNRITQKSQAKLKPYYRPYRGSNLRTLNSKHEAFETEQYIKHKPQSPNSYVTPNPKP